MGVTVGVAAKVIILTDRGKGYAEITYVVRV